MNYFQIFSLPVSFTVDAAALQKQYFALQRDYHPDKIGLEGAQKSMELNQAYDVLKAPLKRAQYFLSLHGIDVGNDDSQVKPAMALLEEMMEKREAVMELESADAAKVLLAKAEAQYDEELAKFSQFAQSIGSDKENAAQSLLRLQYITKWQAEIKQQMKRLESQ